MPGILVNRPIDGLLLNGHQTDIQDRWGIWHNRPNLDRLAAMLRVHPDWL